MDLLERGDSRPRMVRMLNHEEFPLIPGKWLEQPAFSLKRRAPLWLRMTDGELRDRLKTLNALFPLFIHDRTFLAFRAISLVLMLLSALVFKSIDEDFVLCYWAPVFFTVSITYLAYRIWASRRAQQRFRNVERLWSSHAVLWVIDVSFLPFASKGTLKIVEFENGPPHTRYSIDIDLKRDLIYV